MEQTELNEGQVAELKEAKKLLEEAQAIVDKIVYDTNFAYSGTPLQSSNTFSYDASVSIDNAVSGIERALEQGYVQIKI